jgi:hypothetical protein
MSHDARQCQARTLREARSRGRVTREPVERGVLPWVGRRHAVGAGETEVAS